MSAPTVSQRNTAAVILETLWDAEQRICPQPECFSRLHLAVQVASEALSYIQYDSEPGRARLVAALAFMQEVEGDACMVDAQYPAEEYPHRVMRLDPASITGRGFALATHIAYAALAKETANHEHALAEARLIHLMTEVQR